MIIILRPYRVIKLLVFSEKVGDIKLLSKLTLNIVEHQNGHLLLITNPLFLNWGETENKKIKNIIIRL